MSETADTPSQQEFLGAQLRALRGARRVSLGDVARETGISASFLSLVENGRSDITIGRLTRLVDYYGIRHGRISLSDLFRDDSAGAYYYRRGFNPRALAAFVPAAAVSAVIALAPRLGALAPFAWLFGSLLAAGIYWALYAFRPADDLIVATLSASADEVAAKDQLKP